MSSRVDPANVNSASSAGWPPSDAVVSVEDFTARAKSWIETHRDQAPPDYGAILPPGLFERGVAWQKLLFAEGFAGIDWPVAYGGQGLTNAHRGAWIRECALAGVPPFLNMVGMVLAGGSTLAFGSDEQKTRHLRDTLAADQVWCQLFSEPGAGSDLGSLSTKATLDGDSYIVSGQKVWCSGGRYSNRGILMARTDPTVAKHRGISFFLIDMDVPGIDIRPLKQMTGEAEFDEVFFNDVRIPESALLGPLHGGWMVGMATLTNERGSIGTASISLGRRMDALLNHIRAAASESSEGLDANERDALMRLYSNGRALTMLGQRQGEVASTASSLLKLGITELMFNTSVQRTALAGTSAMLADNDAAQSLLAAPGGRIAGGTSQIQRNLIGERLLGLPAEPKISDAKPKDQKPAPTNG
jgi:alkylation response protein AidB-like acyl-CoA dehydrogenase